MNLQFGVAWEGEFAFDLQRILWSSSRKTGRSTSKMAEGHGWKVDTGHLVVTQLGLKVGLLLPSVA
jgi:hypothetical protein